MVSSLQDQEQQASIIRKSCRVRKRDINVQDWASRCHTGQCDEYVRVLHGDVRFVRLRKPLRMVDDNSANVLVLRQSVGRRWSVTIASKVRVPSAYIHEFQ